MMLEQIFNHIQMGPTLHSSGMPTSEQLLSLAEDGIEVVINLATQKSEGWMPEEGEVVAAQGITYHSIPVDWDHPTTNDLNKFMALMDKHKGQKILVHCQVNYRATAFITLYRITFLGWTEENAFRDLKKIWDPAQHPIWQKFMEKKLKTIS
jgi:protein tyrosine phosphatase (PTP) superfamily phosphohydrolase (DUF442 family)